MNSSFKKFLVVDDEHYATLLIENFISKYTNAEMITRLKDPIAALLWLQEHTTDLLFLDISMPHMNGISLLGKLTTKPMTIFTTAHPNYAHTAYELDAVDYLLKPFSYERFCRAMTKAENVAKTSSIADAGVIQVRNNRMWVNVPHRDILYVEAWKEYIRIHLRTEVITTLMSMQQIEEQLPVHFLRIHRSYIVPLGQVRSFGADEVELSHGLKLPVSKSRKEALAHAMRMREKV